jgi:hypothetical protein
MASRASRHTRTARMMSRTRRSRRRKPKRRRNPSLGRISLSRLDIRQFEIHDLVQIHDLAKFCFEDT